MSAAHEPQNCPACGKALPMWRMITEYRHPHRVVLGRQPAWRPYKPFCTLRCALAYAQWMHDRYGHMFIKEAK